MTTTLPPRPAAVAAVVLPPSPVLVPDRATGIRPARPLRSPAAAAACPIELRALRTGARRLADAFTGIALDAPCDRRRQGALVDSARLVLGGVRGAAGRLGDRGLLAAADDVQEALPTFAHDVSAGAPALALACAALADRLDAVDVPVHDHGPQASPVTCERRFRAGAGPARTVVPWFLDAASPAERVAVVRDGSPRVRWALRLGEDRHQRTADVVRG